VGYTPLRLGFKTAVADGQTAQSEKREIKAQCKPWDKPVPPAHILAQTAVDGFINIIFKNPHIRLVRSDVAKHLILLISVYLIVYPTIVYIL
jgi:hypothetical protein